MNEPLLVEVAIESVDDEFLINLSALIHDVNKFGCVCNRLNAEVFANKYLLEMLLR